MQTTTLSLDNIHANGALFANLLGARGAIQSNAAAQFDQYDTPASRWVTVHDGDRVMAAMRLTPTTHRCGVFSYRIRDAQRGLVDGIDSNPLFEDAPVADYVWECSRLFVAPDLTPAQTVRAWRHLATELMRAARAVGASTMIGMLTTDVVDRARRAGLDLAEAGPTVTVNGKSAVCVRASMQAALH